MNMIRKTVRYAKHILTLFKGFLTMALAELDAEARFRAQALRGKSARGLELLDKIDRHFGRE